MKNILYFSCLSVIHCTFGEAYIFRSALRISLRGCLGLALGGISQMICFARMEFQKLHTYDLRINNSVIVHLLYSGDLNIIIQAIEISRIV